MTKTNHSLQLIIDLDSCIGCTECVHGCPNEALFFSSGTLIHDSGACDLTLNCVEICPSLCFRVIDISANRDIP